MKLFSDLNFFLHIESLSVYHPVSKTLYAKNSILYFLSKFENRKQNKIKTVQKKKEIRSCRVWKQIVVAIVPLIAISIHNNRREMSRESRVPNPSVSQRDQNAMIRVPLLSDG